MLNNRIAAPIIYLRIRILCISKGPIHPVPIHRLIVRRISFIGFDTLDVTLHGYGRWLMPVFT